MKPGNPVFPGFFAFAGKWNYFEDKWTKADNGNDYLIDLKRADVGAIYLGNADTQFRLKNSENRLNAEINKTGIYLRESSGAVGTLNHVDLVI